MTRYNAFVLTEAVCDFIWRWVDSPYGLAVATLRNWEALRAQMTLPAPNAHHPAVHVAVGASRTDWMAFGALSDAHAGLIVPSDRLDAAWDIDAMLDRYGFTDPWGPRQGRLLGVAPIVSFEGRTYRDAFTAVDRELLQHERRRSSGEPEPNRIERWCTRLDKEVARGSRSN